MSTQGRIKAIVEMEIVPNTKPILNNCSSVSIFFAFNRSIFGTKDTQDPIAAVRF